MKVCGQAVQGRARPAEAIKHGLALVTEDRKAQGLLLKQNVTINTTISGLKQF